MIRNASLNEIAKLAGVSISTVSRVLNGKPGISTETRNHVLDTYRNLASSSKKNRDHQILMNIKSIGLVLCQNPQIPTPDSMYMTMAGVLREAARSDYNVLTTSVTVDEVKKGIQPKIIKERKVNGIILIGSQIPSSLIPAINKMDVPVILINNITEGNKIDCILNDDSNSIYELTKHFIVFHGHRNIVFISGPKSWFETWERTSGYDRAMKQANLKPKIITMVDAEPLSGYYTTKKLLTESPDTTAIVAFNDLTAIGIIKASREMGYSVPEDIAVTGFGNMNFSEYFYPSLTTVQNFAEEKGKKAVSRLIDIITNNAVNDHICITFRLPSKIIIRNSCGC